MKIRTDFVTNSSSSSFIAIIKKDFEKSDFSEPAVNALLEHALEEIRDNGYRLDGEEEVTEYVVSEFGHDNQLQMMVDDQARDMFTEYMDKIRNGYEIYSLRSVDDCDELHHLLSTMSGSGSKNIIVRYVD